MMCDLTNSLWSKRLDKVLPLTDSVARKFYILEEDDNPYMLHLPKTSEGLLDRCKVFSAECVGVKFASHETEDLGAMETP